MVLKCYLYFVLLQRWLLFLFFIMFFVTAEKFIFEPACKVLDACYFVGDSFLDSFHERLFCFVFVENENISIFIVCLKTSIVPVLDEMVTDIPNCLSCESHPHVVPWKSRLIP